MTAFPSERIAQLRADKRSKDTLIEALAEIERLSGRVCVTCGRILPASHSREESPADCPMPEVCSIDMTMEEAFNYWRKVAHDRYAESRKAIALNATGLTYAQLEGLASGTMVCVSAEPTAAQIIAGQLAILDSGYANEDLHDSTLRKAFRAMIAAKEG